LIGALLGDRYRVIERIGVGGMGAVYRALHTALKRDVAIKVLLPDFGGKDEFVRRFEREAESASRLAHPNIIAITDFGRTPEGLLFLAMEFLDGQALTVLIGQGPIARARATSIMRQILSALGHAHATGVVHRDLKPDNIMLVTRHAQPDVVKILDFGMAKLTDAASGGEPLTQAGMIFGTPEYLSPEQALGDTVDARADLYAAGVILFEMLTGRRPFESPDKVRIISMHLSQPPPRMSDINPGLSIPGPLEDLVRQSLEKHRENRFGSASAFLTALDEVDQELLPAPPAAAPAPSWPLSSSPSSSSSSSSLNRLGHALSRRHPALPLASVAALLLAGAVLAVFAAGRSSRRHATPHVNTATASVTRPAPAPAALAARIRVVEGLLGTGEIIKARVALEQLLAENPGNARVHYLLGRLAFAETHHAEALDDYRQAITLDPGFRGDPILLDHLAEAIVEPRTTDAALDLAIERVGLPAADLLERIANGFGELRRRQRAARALAELGEERRVDLVALHSAELRKANTCDEKKPLVIALGKTDDPRALPALRAQRSRRGIEGLFGGDPDNGCMKLELGDAIARLEAKLPPDKRPPPRPPVRRTSSLPSLFRGR